MGKLRRRIGARRALAERIKFNLGLEGVDNSSLPALIARVDEMSAELGSAHEQLADRDQTMGALAETLAAYMQLTDRLCAQLEAREPESAYMASPSMIERIQATTLWLKAQPRSDLLVSVIIATRNRAALLERALASIQAQTHARWEAIVVDDGSEDGTAEVLEAIDDERVRSVRTEGIGAVGARNAGLDVAEGEIIAYLDDDNSMLPGWLAALAWAFSHFEDVDVVYGARIMEDESAIGAGGRLPRLSFSPFDRQRLLEGNYIDTGVIAHRSHLPQGRWNPSLSALGDWDLILRLTEEKPALALPFVAILYHTSAPGRLSSEQTSVENDRQKITGL